MTTGTQRNGTQINALFCDLHVETMTFGPSALWAHFKTTSRSARSETLGPDEVTNASV